MLVFELVVVKPPVLVFERWIDRVTHHAHPAIDRDLPEQIRIKNVKNQAIALLYTVLYVCMYVIKTRYIDR